MHIANGMYGLILVEPEAGLPPVDREFSVLQSEFYAETALGGTKGKKGGDDDAIAVTSYQRGLNEDPTAVVFNGREGSLTEKPLVCRQGETVRIFFGNAGPSLVSSFHVIGQIFDKVYREGDLISAPARGIQTTLVPAGGAAVVDIKASVPGSFTLVDHSIFRLDKGCVGFLKVIGNDPRHDIYAASEPLRNCEGCKLHN